jgi:hypothetical protein
MAQENKFPSELVDLPSKGNLYPEDSPLASGKIEMKYMSAKEEDILTNQNYIDKGVVIDKLLQALIVDSTIPYDNILVGDKNAMLVAARILGYGKDYEFSYAGEKHTIDLSLLDNKKADVPKGKNEFSFQLPASGRTITYKLLTHGDENKIDQELKGLRKINKDNVPELTTRLKYMILSVDGNEERKTVREFVDKELLSLDSRALRKEINRIQPDIDLTFYPEGVEEGVNIPIGINFLYPDARI